MAPPTDAAALLERELALWRRLVAILDAQLAGLTSGDLAALRAAVAEQEALGLTLHAARRAREATVARLAPRRLADVLPADTLSELRRTVVEVERRLVVCRRLIALGLGQLDAELAVLTARLGASTPWGAAAPGAHAVDGSA